MIKIDWAPLGHQTKNYTFLHKNKKPYNRCGCKALFDVPGGHTISLVYQWSSTIMFTFCLPSFSDHPLLSGLFLFLPISSKYISLLNF